MSNHPTEQRQEVWNFSHSLSPENPSVGLFSHTTLFYGIKLRGDQQNWLMTNVPSLNPREGWRIKSLMLRYRTRGIENNSFFGGIDKIGIRDGNFTLHEFAPLASRTNNTWETLKLELSDPKSFNFGLGVSIHVSGFVDASPFDPPEPPPEVTSIEFVSIGLEFIKSGLPDVVLPSG